MARQQIDKAKADQRAQTRKANKEKKGAVAVVREGLRDKPTVGVEKQEEEEGAAVGAKRKRKVEDEVVDTLHLAAWTMAGMHTQAEIVRGRRRVLFVQNRPPQSADVALNALEQG